MKDNKEENTEHLDPDTKTEEDARLAAFEREIEEALAEAEKEFFESLERERKAQYEMALERERAYEEECRRARAYFQEMFDELLKTKENNDNQ